MRSRANDRLAEAEIKGATEDDLEGLRAWISLQSAAYNERAAQVAVEREAAIAAAQAQQEPLAEPAGEALPVGLEAIPPGAVPPGGVPLQ